MSRSEKAPGVDEVEHDVDPLAPGAGLLRSTVRRDIVETLANLDPARRRDGLTATELGELIDLHVTTVRFHVSQLVEAGILETHSVRTPGAGRPSKRYVVARGSVRTAADAEAYQELAALLAETLAATRDGHPLTPEEAGIDWARRHSAQMGAAADPEPARSAGAWLSKLGTMIDVLRDWGYTPNLSTHDDGRRVDVELVDCPFLPLARTHPEVVCAVHRGLMRGTLEVLGEDDTELSLIPFVEPQRCLAHVTTRTDFALRGGPR